MAGTARTSAHYSAVRVQRPPRAPDRNLNSKRLGQGSAGKAGDRQREIERGVGRGCESAGQVRLGYSGLRVSGGLRVGVVGGVPPRRISSPPPPPYKSRFSPKGSSITIPISESPISESPISESTFSESHGFVHWEEERRIIACSLAFRVISESLLDRSEPSAVDCWSYAAPPSEAGFGKGPLFKLRRVVARSE